MLRYTLRYLPRRTPLLSILLPTHNRADVLRYAIESVLAQTVRSFELLIVGDGCTDHTAEVVRSFRDRRLRWYDLPKAPHFGYANRNLALREARGAYIGFMAHDDLILYDHFERCLLALETHRNLDLVYTRPLWVTPDGYIIPLAYTLYDAHTYHLFMSRQINGIPATCVVHRRSCFERCGYWDESLPGCGDWDMWVRIIESGSGRNFAFLPDPTSLHFRAIWRTDANAGPRELITWRAFYDQTPSFPEALKVDIPEGMPEQQVFWARISEDPRAWAGRVRWAVTHALDLRVADADRRLGT
jgi:glycosyltransferase involved in cell wall biosynthesis